MKQLEAIKVVLLAALIVAGACLQAGAQGRPPLRDHTATKAAPLELVTASRRLSGGQVAIVDKGQTRRITSNGVPTHTVGPFPNRGNPHQIAGQSYRFTVAAVPAARANPSDSGRLMFGVAVNGVPFDPGAAEFWRGNPRSGWVYEALGGAVPLGLDANYAHVQPGGQYHYHGLPTGLMAELGWSANRASPLIGYAADGFPIYAVTVEVNGRVKKMQSSYRLKSGARPGGAGPTGRYDGAFVQDYVYVAGAGDLDACNGAVVRTAEYPQGTYAYILTEAFPVIPRCFTGRADRSFSKRR